MAPGAVCTRSRTSPTARPRPLTVVHRMEAIRGVFLSDQVTPGIRE